MAAALPPGCRPAELAQAPRPPASRPAAGARPPGRGPMCARAGPPTSGRRVHAVFYPTLTLLLHCRSPWPGCCWRRTARTAGRGRPASRRPRCAPCPRRPPRAAARQAAPAKVTAGAWRSARRAPAPAVQRRSLLGPLHVLSCRPALSCARSQPERPEHKGAHAQEVGNSHGTAAAAAAPAPAARRPSGRPSASPARPRTAGARQRGARLRRASAARSRARPRPPGARQGRAAARSS